VYNPVKRALAAVRKAKYFSSVLQLICCFLPKLNQGEPKYLQITGQSKKRRLVAHGVEFGLGQKILPDSECWLEVEFDSFCLPFTDD